MNRAAGITSNSKTKLRDSDAGGAGDSKKENNDDKGGDATAALIRPRNRRLISTFKEEQELVGGSTSSAIGTGTSTPGGSRAASPIPSKYPSRGMGRGLGGDFSAGASGSGSGRPGGRLMVPQINASSDDRRGRSSSPQPGFAGLWEGGWTRSSWSAFQGLASSVLGGDRGGADATATADGGWGLSRNGKGKRKESSSWGPAGLPKKKEEDAIGAGSAAEREAAVRARRTRGVLEGRDDDLNVRKDTNGNYKRRTSVEESRPGGSQDEIEDALVYVHHVQPQDTLAGVILRYNCQPAVFRKANRFWPNDSIQTRKVVVIPVEASTIKGRPCEPPTEGSQGVDLLAPTPNIEEPPFANGGSWQGLASSQNESSTDRTENEEHPWTHVRWVLIDSSPSARPVEIARMPRKTLGYFPPRRRKSQNTISTASTPSGSFDLSRLTQTSPDPPSTAPGTPSRRTSNLGPRPAQSISGSYFPPATSSTRPRRESVGEAADRLGWMRGPGGVGTFGKNVRKPGPGQDGLNAWAKKHIPGLAIDSLPSASLVGGESAHFGFSDELASIAEGAVHRAGSGTATPSSGTGQGLGIEHAAAAIENWVRRLAIKGPGTPKMGGRSENADLIELLDGAGSDDGRGFELSPGSLRPPVTGLGGSGREDLEGVIRGRASAGAKGGKSD